MADKALYLIVGALVGIPLGMIIFKYLFGQPSQVQALQAQQAVYGFNYSYDSQGHLTSYTPVPLGAAPVTTSQPSPSTSASSQSSSASQSSAGQSESSPISDDGFTEGLLLA